MSTGPLVLRPGIDIVKTPLLNEGGFSDSNLIRWFNGQLQKLGGCSRLSTMPVSGIATALHPFTDLAGNNYIGIGTSNALQLYAAQALTKDAFTSNIAMTGITLTEGLTTVTVVDHSYTPAIGQTVVFNNTLLQKVNAGPIIQGSVTVVSVNSGANSWTFDLPSPVPSGGSGSPLTIGLFTEGGVSSPLAYLFPPADVGWLVGSSVSIAFPISLSGSGLTPSTIPPGTFPVVLDFGGVGLDFGSTTNATLGVVHVQENANQANISYQTFTEYAAGSINNIPPPVVVSNLALSAITLTDTSTEVTVIDASYTPTVGQLVTFTNTLLQPTNSGPFIFGTYAITSVDIASNSWTFDLPSAASISDNPLTIGLFTEGGVSSPLAFIFPPADVGWLVGAQLTLAYPIALPGTGLTPSTVPAGTYTVVNVGGGTPGPGINFGSSTNATSGIAHVQENGDRANLVYSSPASYNGVWSLDNWGQNLVGSPQGGPIYSWTPPLPDMSEFVVNGPQFNNVLFVAMPQQQMVSCGSDGGGFLDPLLIRWSDISDYTSATSWVALATNQAGSFRLSSGSLIIGALQGPQQGFIWTDVDMWVMQYIGFPFVYGFNRVGQACGLIAKRAVAQIGGALWWLGKKGAFYYDGASVKPLPCPVWDFFWNNVDQSNLQSVFAALNSDFNEVSWYFPTTTSAGVAINYIKLNVQNPSAPAWDYGVLTRYAWCDRSVIGPAVGVDANNLLQQHETSNDLDGVAMDSFGTTGWVKLAEGQDFITIKRLIWDSIINGSGSPQMLVTVYVANYPNDTPAVYGPYVVDNTTQYITVKARGRIARLKFESVDLGSFWRLGQPIVVISNTGRR